MPPSLTLVEKSATFGHRKSAGEKTDVSRKNRKTTPRAKHYLRNAKALVFPFDGTGYKPTTSNIGIASTCQTGRREGFECKVPAPLTAEKM
jgi:hypothetical protein